MLRNVLLRDSKQCQLEQIREHQKRLEMIKDWDDNWHEVLKRSNQKRFHRESFSERERRREGIEIQDFQKLQIFDKNERKIKSYHEEVDEELKREKETAREEEEQDRRRKNLEETNRKFVEKSLQVC